MLPTQLLLANGERGGASGAGGVADALPQLARCWAPVLLRFAESTPLPQLAKTKPTVEQGAARTRSRRSPLSPVSSRLKPGLQPSSPGGAVTAGAGAGSGASEAPSLRAAVRRLRDTLSRAPQRHERSTLRTVARQGEPPAAASLHSHSKPHRCMCFDAHGLFPQLAFDFKRHKH